MMLRIGNKQQGIGCRVQGTEKKLNPEPRTLNPEKGLTLIEVLLAVSILAIGIIGVLRAYAGSIATLEVGQYSINAVNLLKQKMADVEQMVREKEGDLSGRKQGEFEDEFNDFHWEWDIQPIDIETDTETKVEGFYELTLTVSHKDNPRTYTLKTYVIGEKEDEEE